MMRIEKLPIPFFKHLLFRVRIEGESMWPHLIPGKMYWASALIKPKRGSVVVCRDPRYEKRLMVKRVAAVEKAGYALESIVWWGAGSKDFGIVSFDAIMGTVMHH